MKDRTIAIRNVYVMMAYAFRSITKDTVDKVETEEFDHIHDLFSEILARGVSSRLKRGLHHDYLRKQDRLFTVRGRVEMSESVLSRASTPGKIVCTYDEYESDTPFNQALKSVIILLIRHGTVAKMRKDALRRLLPYFESITLVDPYSIKWGKFSYTRSNAEYRLLLGVCELVVRGLISSDKPGDARLRSWLSDEAMSSLYERFLREYFVFHHRELSPAARTVPWDFDELSSTGASQLPAMRTDIMLKRNGKTLIIDAKYYGSSMQSGPFGTLSIHSANLYQITTYVRNADTQGDGSVSGLLLYARTDAPTQPKMDLRLQGNRIGADTLDLNRPWEQLRDQLESISQWL